MAKAAGAAIPALLGAAGVGAGTAATIGAIGAPLVGAGIGALMSKGGAAAPASVDPAALAAQQTQSNIQSSQVQSALQNVNTFSPYGSTVYTPYTNAQGQQAYTLNQQLSPQLQQLFGTQTGGAQALANLIAGQAGTATGLAGTGANLVNQGAGLASQITGAPANLPGAVANLTPGSFQTNVTGGAGGQPIPQVQTGVNANFPQLVQQAQDAAYKSQTQYLDPQFNQNEQQLTQQLADQGLQPGTEAYDRAMGDFNRQKQMAYGNAQMQAVQAGNQQQQALFGQSLESGQFTNQANQQLFGQGVNLADLYNQAVLGASGQNLQAQQANLNLAQTGWQDPQQALSNLVGAGGGLYGAGMGTLGTLAGLSNVAPTWPLGITTEGAQPITSTAPNLGMAVSGATSANQLANTAFNRNLSNLNQLGGQALFGQPTLTGGLFGSGSPLAGGLFGLLGGGGGGGAGYGLVGQNLVNAAPLVSSGGNVPLAALTSSVFGG